MKQYLLFLALILLVSACLPEYECSDGTIVTNQTMCKKYYTNVSMFCELNGGNLTLDDMIDACYDQFRNTYSVDIETGKDYSCDMYWIQDATEVIPDAVNRTASCCKCQLQVK